MLFNFERLCSELGSDCSENSMSIVPTTKETTHSNYMPIVITGTMSSLKKKEV